MKYLDDAFPNIPFGHSAYDVETKGLTHEEKGVYVDLMILVWRRKCKPIPDNDEKISRMIGCTLDRWTRKLRPALEHLFIISEEGWRHERMEQRWAGIEEKSAVSSQKGKLGGRPSNRQTADTFANLLAENVERISQTQTANLLENNETAKAAAFNQLKLDESYKIESKKEESKNPPISPPMGGHGVVCPERCLEDGAGLAVRAPGSPARTPETQKAEKAAPWKIGPTARPGGNLSSVLEPQPAA